MESAMTLAGLPLVTDFPVAITEEMQKQAEGQKKEIECLGLRLVGIHIVEPASPMRFFIEFPPTKPSYEVRRKLEEAGYDVGQQMGDKILKFYATRRAQQGEGWQV